MAWDAAVQRLYVPVDIASLVAFRLAFGAIMLWEVWRYYQYGWINRYFIEPRYHFTYFGFDWVRPWPGDAMYLHFWVMAILAVCIMVGALYRLSAALFFLAISYVFLLDQANYLNHIYLVCLISFIMILIPTHRWLSVDSWIWPRRASQLAPTWALWLLRFQIAVPYTYGGIAKLNADWLQGEPVRMWLRGSASTPYIGPWLASEWGVALIAYGGLLFDLAIVPMLFWRRTRLLAFGMAIIFHVTNAHLFTIGIFPWFMIAATLLFFSPGWPRIVWQRLSVLLPRGRSEPAAGPAAPTLAPAPAPAVPPSPSPASSWSGPGRGAQLLVAFLGVYVAVQLLLPFRHLLYPGDVAWNEEGHRFSWRMKLRDKSHQIVYYAFSPSTGRTWTLRPRDYLSTRQENSMDGRPDMVLQLAHWMADDIRGRGYADVQIYVRAMTSLNGRARQDLIDPHVDLTTRHRSIWPADWVLPLDEPLRRR
jgi:vitamin K-dependent gamma-carboxylase